MRVFGGRMGHWLKRQMTLSKMRNKNRQYLSMIGLAIWLIASIFLLASLYGSGYDLSALSFEQLGLSNLSASDEHNPGYVAQLYRTIWYDTTFQYPSSYKLQQDLLTVQVGPHKGEKIKKVEDLQFYSSDPRLVWSVLADFFTQSQDPSVLLPFSWYDWADFGDYNKLISLQDTTLTCDFLFGHHFNGSLLSQIEDELGETLFDIDREYYNHNTELQSDQLRDMFQRANSSCVVEDTTKSLNSAGSNDSHGYSIGIVATALKDQVRPEVYRFQARNYLLHASNSPLSLTILNGDTYSWQFIVDQTSRQNLAQSGLLNNYVKQRTGVKQDFTFDYVKEFKKFTKSESSNLHQVRIEGLQDNEHNAFEKYSTNLKKSDFEFDALARIQELKNQRKPLNAHEQSYLESLEFSTQTHFAFAPKYFNEPGGLQDFLALGRHHDARFFNGAIFRDVHESQLRLNSMMVTFQKFLKANSLICWLAHGSLYGYLYNGEAFPWDNDFDMQMPIRHLHILAQHFNQTLVLEDPREGNGRFLLDIGSSITTRIQGNGDNNIDARFIDIDSGLYIDITALSVSSAMLSVRDKAFFNANKDKVGLDIKHRDPNLIFNKTDVPLQVLYNKVEESDSYSEDDKKRVKTMIAKYNDQFPGDKSPSKYYSVEQRYNLNYELSLFNCRNHHFVHFDMISPLIATKFHGVSALVPAKYISALRREYQVPMKMSAIAFQAKSFVPGLRTWIPVSLLRKLMNTNGRIQELESIKTPVSNFNLSDIAILVKNAASSNEADFLSTIYSSKEMSTYRLKEIELHFSQNHNITEKEYLLTRLRSDLGSKIKPIMTDPYISYLQKMRWREVSKEENFNQDDLQFVDLAKAEKIDAWNLLLANKSLPFYKADSSSEIKLDLDDFNVVNGGFNSNDVFKEDPELF
ncbi:LANO_0F15346g1_1 [Lachancea nothofagi CBS 11611]|uniref:LANO_0F15346g1_1 n=1 Tax=Lachancea nothofagi CBS 11611 TaxID=1266666 RepID=A0A1G4KCK5_9SACH|nr:LANO_0F15346g1_1 [Lachancea nothofagi CBS 11611]